MCPRPAEPTILPPRPAGEVRSLDDETLEMLASLLDDAFQIPGTAIRFGLDPLVGLVPGIGDLITGFASFLIIFSAWQRRVPKATVARMVVNVGIDSLVGAIPFLGDAFDVAWKSNRKNIGILRRASADTSRGQSWHDWLFLLGVAVVVATLVAIPVALLWLVVHYFLAHR